MKDGVELIAEERVRHVTQEGWTAEHDDEHKGGELALAAACYATPAIYRGHDIVSDERHLRRQDNPPFLWPWEKEWWKPNRGERRGRIRELVKAGGLIAAEIDRLQRMEPAVGFDAGMEVGGTTHAKVGRDYLPGTIRVDMHWDDNDGEHHRASGYINESWLLQRKRELESTHEQ